MKKFFLALATCLFMCTLFPFAACDQLSSSDSGKVTYAVCEGGAYAEVTGYSGSPKHVVIADTYEGVPVTTIRDSAFFLCESLQTVKIGKNVHTIGAMSFAVCLSLQEITIPKSVSMVNTQAFDGNLSTQKIYYEGNIEDWVSIIFSNYTACPLTDRTEFYINDELVTEVVIPDGVTMINNYSFVYYPFLESVTMSDSVTTIGTMAFSHCKNLSKITFSENLTTIGGSAFSYCDKLETVVLPESLLDLQTNAFSHCSHLKSVTVGNQIRTINSGTFSYCTSLEEVYLGYYITFIDLYAFGYCTKLEYIHFNNTKDRWKIAVEKDSGWNSHSNIKKIICNDGEIRVM